MVEWEGKIMPFYDGWNASRRTLEDAVGSSRADDLRALWTLAEDEDEFQEMAKTKGFTESEIREFLYMLD